MKLIGAATVLLLTVSACASGEAATAPRPAKQSRTTAPATASHRPSSVASRHAPSKSARPKTPRPSPVRTRHHQSSRLASYPQVNNPCKGQIPQPFAGIATDGHFGTKVAAFRRSTGAHVRLVEFYNRFPGSFQRREALQVVRMHELPLIQLNPTRISMARLAAGAYDSQIRSYARQVKAFRCHVVLSLGHEMNGWWYPWGLPGTTPHAFKTAWRHFFNIFAAEHVTNVIRSWDPSHEHGHFRSGKVAWPASRWYPGNKYVDWIGIDGYFSPGHNFRDVLRYQLRNIRRLTHKPIYLAETGVADSARQARQIAGLFAGIWKWHLIGLVWFDQDRRFSWTLGGKPRKDAAFRRAVARFP
jgi:mannan endo-1,4-beta-mannosidase